MKAGTAHGRGPRGEDRGVNGRTIAVVGARGGAGASSFAAALARALVRTGRRRRAPVVLLDLASGPSIDVLLGLEHAPGPRWAEVVEGAAATGLPEWAGVRVLARDRSGPAPGAAVRREVVAALAGSGSSVVLDLGTVEDEAGLLGMADTVLMVAARDVRSAAGVLRRRPALEGTHGDVRLVVRGPAPGGLGALELAHVVDLPVAASGRADRRLDSALEHGLGPPPRGPLARLAARVVEEL